MIISTHDGTFVVDANRTGSSDASIAVEPTTVQVAPGTNGQVIDEMVDKIVRRYRRALDKLARE